MEEPVKQRSPLQRPFVIIGASFGVFLSMLYLYNNFGIKTDVPDPVWLKFVKVALIIFCSIYLANSFRNMIELIFRKKQ